MLYMDKKIAVDASLCASFCRPSVFIGTESSEANSVFIKAMEPGYLRSNLLIAL